MYPGTWAQETPDKPAVVLQDSGAVITFRALDEQSNRLAHLWRSHGLQSGDRVAVVMENHPRFFEVAWAALRSGLVLTPVNWHLTVGEMAYIVTDCGARAVVTSPAHAELVARLLPDTPGIESVLVTDAATAGLASYEDAIAEQPVHAVPDESAGTDMIYSSGTTGKPKGGVRPLPRWHPASPPRAALAFYELFGFDADTVFLSPGAPLYHAAPLRFSLAVTSFGGTVVVTERFDAGQAVAAIDEHGITHSQWVPTMFQRMLRLPEAARAAYRGEAHRVAIHGAAPCPVAVKEQMIEWWGPIVCEYYGGSEGGALAFLTAREWLEHKGSVGRAVVGEIHITDEDGRELPPGRVGAVRFAGGVRINYHNDPAKTAAAYDSNGWATVGDVGYVDEGGYLYLTDRQDFMIISGGVNIYPKEVEELLLLHPMVADVAVVGVPNPDFGEEVKAVVELIDPSLASPALADELLAFCRERLAKFKCPRTIDFDAELPRAPSGKLYKRRVRDRYWADQDGRAVVAAPDTEP